MENKEQLARFLVLTHLFAFCAIALIYRNIVLIALAYAVTVIIFATSPFRNLLNDKGIMIGFCAFHMSLFVMAGLISIYPSTGIRVWSIIAILIVAHFTLYRKRKSISTLL
jgi:hypothetical protein